MTIMESQPPTTITAQRLFFHDQTPFLAPAQMPSVTSIAPIMYWYAQGSQSMVVDHSK